MAVDALRIPAARPYSSHLTRNKSQLLREVIQLKLGFAFIGLEDTGVPILNYFSIKQG